MGQIFDARGGKTVDVPLNVVPFIDLMSCLTAFLLVTAVWVDIAQLPVQPTGRDRNTCDLITCHEGPFLSVLIEPEAVWVGVSRLNEIERIPHTAGGVPDWDRLDTSLRAHKASAIFADRTSIELAAAGTDTDPVAYHTLIAAMDVAVQAGFPDVGLTDAAGLSTRPLRDGW